VAVEMEEVVAVGTAAEVRALAAVGAARAAAVGVVA